MTPTVFDCHDGHKANGQNVNYSQADRLPGHPDGSADIQCKHENKILSIINSAPLRLRIRR